MNETTKHPSWRLPPNPEEYKTAEYLIYCIIKEIRKQHPKLKSVESNLFHFIIHDIQKKLPKEIKLAHGWYYWGPYYPVVDDVLVDNGAMDAKYHQMNPKCDHTMPEYMIDCDCHPKPKIVKPKKKVTHDKKQANPAVPVV
jgi:hypothetical protein